MKKLLEKTRKSGVLYQKYLIESKDDLSAIPSSAPQNTEQEYVIGGKGNYVLLARVTPSGKAYYVSFGGKSIKLDKDLVHLISKASALL